MIKLPLIYKIYVDAINRIELNINIHLTYINAKSDLLHTVDNNNKSSTWPQNKECESLTTNTTPTSMQEESYPKPWGRQRKNTLLDQFCLVFSYSSSAVQPSFRSFRVSGWEYRDLHKWNDCPSILLLEILIKISSQFFKNENIWYTFSPNSSLDITPFQ